jgi:23S rRNA pseudouridine2457 synthase
MFRYFIANKPFNVICQFTAEAEGQVTLANLNADLPNDVYPIGRLDQDSEGLLLLSSDRKLNHTLLNPLFEHERTYLAQVEEQPSEADIATFCAGLEIKVEKKNYTTLPCKARLISDDLSGFFAGNQLWMRTPPAKASANKPMFWLEVTLTEGKNRQVRKMCAKIGHPCLRLIRVRMKNLHLSDLATNEVKEFSKEDIYAALGL